MALSVFGYVSKSPVVSFFKNRKEQLLRISYSRAMLNFHKRNGTNTEKIKTVVFLRRQKKLLRAKDPFKHRCFFYLKPNLRSFCDFGKVHRYKSYKERETKNHRFFRLLGCFQEHFLGEQIMYRLLSEKRHFVNSDKDPEPPPPPPKKK